MPVTHHHKRLARAHNAAVIKERFQATIGALAGIVLIVVGIGMLNDDRVMCGSEEMAPGEVCEETSHGETTAERSTEEQAGDNTSTGWMLLGGGVLLSAGCGYWASRAYRRKRVTPESVAENAPQPAAPQ